MNPADLLIIVLLGIVVFFACRHLIRQKQKGCPACCSECGHACTARKQEGRPVSGCPSEKISGRS